MCIALGVLFVGLKLAGFISWSWLFVLMPFLVGLVVDIIASLIFFLWWRRD